MTPAMMTALEIVAWMSGRDEIGVGGACDLVRQLQEDLQAENRAAVTASAEAYAGEIAELRNLVSALRVRQTQMQERDARALKILGDAMTFEADIPKGAAANLENAIYILRERIADAPGSE